ncbi:MAG: nucleotidyltransferase family protein [Thermoanaerobaculia bacterium]|nr:nucleotidyltransferase family protein [Thermoanaerobaculia bacterium]
MLENIAGWLEERDVPFALIGGVALAAYGLARTTLDLDLLVDAEAQDDLIRFMEAEGYETLHRSAGYSNHIAPSASAGRVDFVYVRGTTRDRVFAEVLHRTGPGGKSVPIACPEHLIALKLTSIESDPERLLRDLADIRYLMRQPGVDLDAVRQQFERRGWEERFRELDPRS